jgi:uncharacterized protein YjiS (DUF1127 family)
MNIIKQDPLLSWGGIAPDPHLWPSLRTGFQELGAWWVARRRRVALVQALDLLTDRELRDVGLTRFDFQAIADGTYWPG